MLDPQSDLVLGHQSIPVLHPRASQCRVPGASQCWIPEASRAGSLEHSSAAPSLLEQVEQEGDSPCAGGCPSAPPALTFPPLPFLQILTSAPSTGPVTTSASTPPVASSASATRATRSTGSPTAEVGPAGCWQDEPVAPPGLGPREVHGAPRDGAAPRHGCCGTLGDTAHPVGSPRTPNWGQAGRGLAARHWCLQLQTERQEQFATCLQRERGRNPRRFWQGAGTGWEGKHQKGLI